jgi:hypothetical protein
MTSIEENVVKRFGMINLVLLCAGALAFASGCDKDKKDGDKAEVSADKDKESKKGADSPKADDSKKKAADAPKGDKPKSGLTKKADTWKTYNDDVQGFTVQGPVAPEKGEQDIPTVLGNVKAYTYGFTAPGAQGAMIAMVAPNYVKGVELDVKKMLDDGQAGALASMSGTLAESEDIEMDGHPGRMFRFTATPQGMKASGYVKVFLRDDALYQVMMVYADAAPSYKVQGERFVDSFKFLPKKG